MINVWSGIDGRDAESRLRGLTRRLSDLDTALRDQQELLRERPDSFSFNLACESLLNMQTNLQSELIQLVQYRALEKITVALCSDTEHTVAIGFLGTLLIRLQKLFTSIGQSIRTGPTLRGRIPAEIRQLTELRVVAFYPSSFGVTLVSPARYDLMGQSLSAASLNTMFQLLSSTDNDHTLMRFSGELGRRAASHLRHVISTLNEQNSEIKIDWADYTGTQYTWEAGSDKVAAIIERLRNITERRSEEKHVTGRLVGASLLRNRFELLLNDKEFIEGKIVSGLADDVKKAFGKTCVAHLVETEVLDHSTGESRSYYSLMGIE